MNHLQKRNELDDSIEGKEIILLTSPPTIWDRLDIAASFLFCALLAFAPLAYGAVQDWSLFVVECVSTTCLVLVVIQRISSGAKFSGNPLYKPFFCLIILAIMQWSLGWTAYGYATRTSILQGIACLIAFLLTLELFSRNGRARNLVWFLCIYGGLMALFAIVQGFTSEGKLFWTTLPTLGAVIYGSYVNHAHYAGLMELLTPFPLVMALRKRSTPLQSALLGFTGVLMAVSIFLSRSRGGVVTFCVQLAFLGAVFYASGGKRKHMASFVLFVAVLAGLFAWLASSEVTEALSTLKDPAADNVTGFRLHIVQDSLPLIFTHPIFGSGLGTFAHIFPRYQSFYSDFYVNFAHNDYVQFVVEMGLAGVVLLTWALIVFFQRALDGISEWARHTDTAIRLAALTGCVGILIHSLSDFNLHIPANAMLFLVCVALASRAPQES